MPDFDPTDLDSEAATAKPTDADLAKVVALSHAMLSRAGMPYSFARGYLNTSDAFEKEFKAVQMTRFGTKKHIWTLALVVFAWCYALATAGQPCKPYSALVNNTTVNIEPLNCKVKVWPGPIPASCS